MKNAKMFKRLFEDMMKPGFRGLVVFGKSANLRDFMEIFGEYLIVMGGKYHLADQTWQFPWNASIKLSSTNQIERKTNGLVFSHIEMDGEIDEPVKSNIMSKKRIVL